jgi:hypothetical protein
MYSKEYRDRIASFDRMRVEQLKIISLIGKSRELKKKLKNRQSYEAEDNLQSQSLRRNLLPSKRSASPSPPKSKAKDRISYDFVDPSAYG